MRELFIYELEDCVQRVLRGLDDFHGLMDEHVKGVTWNKDTWTLDKLEIFDQELSSKLRDAWFFDGGFICYIQDLSFDIDISQHLFANIGLSI